MEPCSGDTGPLLGFTELQLVLGTGCDGFEAGSLCLRTGIDGKSLQLKAAKISSTPFLITAARHGELLVESECLQSLLEHPFGLISAGRKRTNGIGGKRRQCFNCLSRYAHVFLSRWSIRPNLPFQAG